MHMFGFGKKSTDTKNPEAKKQEQNNAVAAEPAAAIPDDKFVVMPAQYLPQSSGRASSSPGRGINKKVLLLGGGGALALAAFAAVLYVVFLSEPKQPSVASPAPQQQEVPEEDVLEEEPEPAAESESIVRAQAFNETNMLTGSIAITVPPTVAQRYGSGIGATVLAPEDLALPEDGEVLGGLYALYPAGITFEEPLSLELSVANIPASYNAADIYPAYLRGVAWEEFADYQAGLSGYTFMLEKVPSGPIAVIWNPAEEEQSAEDLLFTSVIPTIDTDGDGLTDAEEALFGTSAADPDTDGDTHLDLAEIQNGYSPLEAGALLDGSGLFSTYTNTTYGYRVSYPSSWLASGLDQSNKQVLFVSDTDEFFEILIEENPLNTPIADWFRGQSPSLANVALDVAAVGGKPGVWSPDGLTLYVSSDGLIYIITYNNGTRDDVSWPNAFEYFYKSFSFGSTNSPANEAGEEEEAAEEEA